MQQGKLSKRIERKSIFPSRGQKAIELAVNSHKKFMKVKNVSSGTAAMIWNKKRLIVFLELEEVRYTVSFQRLPVLKPPIFEAYDACVPKQKLMITYALALDDCIVVGTNYGILTHLPSELTKKVHAGEILHIAYRKNLMLTCSDDTTCMLVDASNLNSMGLLKCERYMKEIPLRG